MKFISAHWEEQNGKYVQIPYYSDAECTDKKTIYLSDYKLHQSFSERDFSFTDKVIDWTKVVVQDAPQIEHAWLGGKVVPVTGENVEEWLKRGYKFIPGTAEPRFWMMFVGTLMVVLAIIGLIRNYFRNQNKKGKGDGDE